jgi:hypothetical protein
MEQNDINNNQRPDAVPASLSEGAVETKYKKGDHVWSKQPKELAGRTGYVMEVDTRRMEYEVRFGTEMWIVPENDLELVDPATEEVRQTVFEREDVTDLLTERQAYDDYQERTAKSGDRADQLAWAIVALLAAQLIGGSKYGEMYVMAAGALAYLLLHTLQSAWQGLAIWIVKQRISRGQRLTDYPSWVGGTAWVLYALKLCALTAAAVYGIVHFLRLL